MSYWNQTKPTVKYWSYPEIHGNFMVIKTQNEKDELP